MRSMLARTSASRSGWFRFSGQHLVDFSRVEWLLHRVELDRGDPLAFPGSVLTQQQNHWRGKG